LYHDKEEKGTEQEYWEQEPPPFRSEVARLMPSIRQQAANPQVSAELFKARRETVLDKMHIVCVVI